MNSLNLIETSIKSVLYALLSTAQVETDNKYLDIATDIAKQSGFQDYLEGLLDESDLDYTPDFGVSSTPAPVVVTPDSPAPDPVVTAPTTSA
jgi:hypothetical protein